MRRLRDYVHKVKYPTFHRGDRFFCILQISAQELGNGHIRCSDARERLGSGDDEAPIWLVPVIMRLPQRVRFVPASHIGIDHGTKGTGLPGVAHTYE